MASSAHATPERPNRSSRSATSNWKVASPSRSSMIRVSRSWAAAWAHRARAPPPARMPAPRPPDRPGFSARRPELSTSPRRTRLVPPIPPQPPTPRSNPPVGRKTPPALQRRDQLRPVASNARLAAMRSISERICVAVCIPVASDRRFLLMALALTPPCSTRRARLPVDADHGHIHDIAHAHTSWGCARISSPSC